VGPDEMVKKKDAAGVRRGSWGRRRDCPKDCRHLASGQVVTGACVALGAGDGDAGRGRGQGEWWGASLKLGIDRRCDLSRGSRT